jgi:hypothetical protein
MLVAFPRFDSGDSPATLFARFAFIVLVYAVNSWSVLSAAAVSGGMAAIWSANAILLFAVLGAPANRAAAYILGGFVASIGANLLASSDFALELCQHIRSYAGSRAVSAF